MLQGLLIFDIFSFDFLSNNHDYWTLSSLLIPPTRGLALDLHDSAIVLYLYSVYSNHLKFLLHNYNSKKKEKIAPDETQTRNFLIRCQPYPLVHRAYWIKCLTSSATNRLDIFKYIVCNDIQDVMRSATFSFNDLDFRPSRSPKLKVLRGLHCQHFY